MFERTVAWWRPVTHGTPARAEVPRVADEDRRVWVRHPADAEATFQPAGQDMTPVRLSGRIRDVSQGGMNLVVSQRFEPGSMLSVELPGADGPALEVLACVLHVQQQGENQWSLGCNFVNELEDADMTALGARRERPAKPDPRNWVRFPADVRVKCQTVREGDSQPLEASVVNVSANGIALNVSQAVATGTLLSLEMQGPHGAAVAMLACVVHVSAPQPGTSTLGCNFIRELDESDLQALLA